MTNNISHSLSKTGQSKYRNFLWLALTLLLVIAMSGAPQCARAGTFTVDTLVDEQDGSCSDDCSLRDAISLASPGDSIGFDVTGDIVLSSGLGQLSINKDLMLVGPTTGDIALDGNFATRVISVTTGATLELQNIIIQNGYVDSEAGGKGAGIYNYGTVIATESTFYGNHADSFQTYGGGIYNNGGHITLDKTAFLENSATSEFSYGGGIYNLSGVITITNSTFYSNTAHSNSYAVGGGIINSNGVITITNSTFYNNTATDFASSLHNGGVNGYITLYNTIIADNGVVSACLYSSNMIGNGGNNIDKGSTCGWGSANGSLSNTDPLLGDLDYHGGPTQNFTLLADSPAIDGVIYNAPNNCPATDQRGYSRPLDGDRDGTSRCDIGAYEYPMLIWLPTILRQ